MKKILLKIWGAITLVLAVIAYVFFSRCSNEKMKEAVDKVKEEAKKEQENVNDIKQNIDQRKEKDNRLAEKLKNHFLIILVLFLVVCSFSWNVVAETQPPPEQETSIENLKIPDNYDDLLDRYKDMAMIAIEYQRLYREAEIDNERLVETVERLQKLIEAQQEIIDRGMGREKRKLGLFAGVNFMLVDLEKPELFAGVNYQF